MTTTSQKLLSVSEAAALLGYSKWSVRKFCRQGILRSMKRAGSKNAKVFIPESAITEFLKEQQP